MVYEETFLRNFRFYAKTLTKLHDLMVPGTWQTLSSKIRKSAQIIKVDFSLPYSLKEAQLANRDRSIFGTGKPGPD
jgi:hypothetical protein